MRRQVALLIGDEVDRREREGLDPLDDVDRRMMADAEIRRMLTEHWRTTSQRGEPRLSRDEELHIAEAVRVSVFSALPGLDEYLARPDVTDIFINGCDDVRLRTMEGEEIVVAPLVSSDAELVSMIQGLARRGGRLGSGEAVTHSELGGEHEKEFNSSKPLLNLQLSDGSRLAAAAWITPRPYVSIRRHPLADAAQKDLVARGMYDESIASLLAAAVRARKSIMIAGGQGRGKTTLMRALLHECDPSERIMVLEQEPELQLDADEVRHNQVLNWIARPANMEGEGAVTLADLAWAIKRHNPDRIVVGEVLGAEVMVMLEAAGQGIAGALCTMHSKDAYRVFSRMVHYAQLGQPNVTPAFVMDTAADALDLVVYLDMTPAGTRVDLRDHPRPPLRPDGGPRGGRPVVHGRARPGRGPQPQRAHPRQPARGARGLRLRPGAGVALVSALAALAGLVFAVGVALVVSGARPAPVAPDRAAARARRAELVASRAAVAAGVGLVVLVLTRWPVAAIGAGVAAYVLAGRRGRVTPAAEIDRTEAMASWAEMLRDGVGTPRGIEGIITSTASSAPVLIRPAVMRFAHRLAWQDLHEALPDLAAELDHRIGDLIVTALDISARTGARQVRAVLDDLAEAAREEARMLRRQEVARARPRSEMRQVVFISIAVVVSLAVVGRDYLAPYRSGWGQVVLCLVAGLWAIGFTAMARLARSEPVERFLTLGAAADGRRARP